ncbi:hypothetical protein HK102_006110, partial [Quaeritorhiza haematococci]
AMADQVAKDLVSASSPYCLRRRPFGNSNTADPSESSKSYIRTPPTKSRSPWSRLSCNKVIDQHEDDATETEVQVAVPVKSALAVANGEVPNDQRLPFGGLTLNPEVHLEDDRVNDHQRSGRPTKRGRKGKASVDDDDEYDPGCLKRKRTANSASRPAPTKRGRKVKHNATKKSPISTTEAVPSAALLSLPVELLDMIASHLLRGSNMTKVVPLALTCRFLFQVVSNHPFWHLVARTAGLPPPNPRSRKTNTWMKVVTSQLPRICMECYGFFKRRELFEATMSDGTHGHTCLTCFQALWNGFEIDMGYFEGGFRRVGKERASFEFGFSEGQYRLLGNRPTLYEITRMAYFAYGGEKGLEAFQEVKYARVRERRIKNEERIEERRTQVVNALEARGLSASSEKRFWFFIDFIHRGNLHGAKDVEDLIQQNHQLIAQTELDEKRRTKFRDGARALGISVPWDSPHLTAYLKTGVELTLYLCREASDHARRQQTPEQRRLDLISALQAKGLELPDNCSLCDCYISRGPTSRSLDEIVDIVAESVWCSRRTGSYPPYWRRDAANEPYINERIRSGLYQSPWDDGDDGDAGDRPPRTMRLQIENILFDKLFAMATSKIEPYIRYDAHRLHDFSVYEWLEDFYWWLDMTCYRNTASCRKWPWISGDSNNGDSTSHRSLSFSSVGSTASTITSPPSPSVLAPSTNDSMDTAMTASGSGSDAGSDAARSHHITAKKTFSEALRSLEPDISEKLLNPFLGAACTILK